jgi:predicted Fe-S protein YdhL (DUF1289 family)
VTPQEEVESPCVRSCVIDQNTGFCAGCFRTLHEISYWVSYTREQRLRIMTFVETRRAAHASGNSAS